MSGPSKTPVGRPIFGRLGELFDASALGFVVLLLLGASFFATWRGMQDFITGNDLETGLAADALVLLIVLTLTLAMYVALREMIAPYYVNGWWSAIWKRLIAGALYALLALWSVGFGYGFWWSLLAGQTATDEQLTQVVTSVQHQANDLQARVSAAASAMTRAELLSDQKRDQEAARGGTCGVASRPGDGPLSRARAETQLQIASLSASVRREWLGPLTVRLKELDEMFETALANSASASGREENLKRLDRRLRATASDISANAGARGRTIAAQLKSKAEQLSVMPVGGQVADCYDPDLAASLNAAADEFSQAFNIDVAPFRFSEGADGVARAVEALWARLGQSIGLITNTPSGSTPGSLTGRGLIALLAAIGVDLALFVFGLLRGSGGRRHVYRQRPPLPESIAKAPAQEKQQLTFNAAEVLEDGVIEAEFEETAKAAGQKFLPETFDPGSQVEDSDQIEELLRRVERAKLAMQAASKEVDRAKERARHSDALRELANAGWIAAGGTDQGEALPDLHEVVEARYSSHPEGRIIETIRPRFLDREGNLRCPARVIVSAGPEEA